MGALIGETSVVLALATAWLYIAGWTYAAKYFGEFNIGLLSIDIPEKFFLVYGFKVVQAKWASLVGLLAVGAYAVFLVQRAGRAPVSVVFFGAVILVVALGYIARVAAMSAASATVENNRINHWRDFTKVQVVIREPLPSPGLKQWLGDLATGYCWLKLLETPDTLYVFPSPKFGARFMPRILAIPRADIAAVRNLPNRGACK